MINAIMLNKNRLTSLMHTLTNNTVFGDLLAPVQRALTCIRPSTAFGRVLSMEAFISLGVLRHLQGTQVLREQVQQTLHLDIEAVDRPPLARSTWSDALASRERQAQLRQVVGALRLQAAQTLPDRLAQIPGLGDRPVRSVDGVYQPESAHFRRCTPRDGGEDNPKGHLLLAFQNLRIGVIDDVISDTRSQHELTCLRAYEERPDALTRERRTLWVADRGFIAAAFWDAKKRALGATLITRMKSNLVIDSTEGRPIEPDPINDGVEQDLAISLTSSKALWRRIRYRTPAGERIELLTNDFSLQPGVVAFLYGRRWEQEKSHDQWKNDFAAGKAWGKSPVAIANQADLAIITTLLVRLLLARCLDSDEDQKVLKKQDRRQQKLADHKVGTQRPDWSGAIYRHTSKLSRQVLRFFKLAFLKPASPALYQRQLKPLLQAYL